MKKNEKISIETMSGVGKKKQIAGREYLILPVNVRDMHLIIGEGEDRIIILEKKPNGEDEEVNWQLFGLNIVDEQKRKTFMYVISKYVYYCVNDEKIPMNEEMLIEHNWSFKEIGEFLFAWSQISD